MTKREPLKTEAYFENVISFYEAKVAEYKRDFETKPPEIKRWDNMHMLQYGNYFYLFRACYSAGRPVAELVPLFNEMINHWHAYYTYEGVEPNIKILIDSYVEALQFCSLAILLRPGDDTVNKLKSTMNVIQVDTLLFKFTSFLNFDTAKENKLFFKKSFTPLLAVFEESTIKAKEEKLKTYLTEWMGLMKPTAYEGSHKIKVNDTAFAGYWSFEAATVCVIEALDAEKFNDTTFFPTDLVKYYYETK